MRTIQLLEQIIKDRSIWYNCRTQKEVEVREGNLIDTLRGAHERFDVPADFADRKPTTADATNALLVRGWVSITVMAGATIIHAATEEFARTVAQRYYLHVPTNHVMIEVGAHGRTQQTELRGRDAVVQFAKQGQSQA
jgi:hypothetical protein